MTIVLEKIEKKIVPLDIQNITKIMNNNNITMKEFREVNNGQILNKRELNTLDKMRKKDKKRIKGKGKKRWIARTPNNKNRVRSLAGQLNKRNVSPDAKANIKATLSSIADYTTDISKTKLGKIQQKKKNQLIKKERSTFLKSETGKIFNRKNKKLDKASQRATLKLSIEDNKILNNELSNLKESKTSRNDIEKYRKLRSIELAGGTLKGNSADFVDNLQIPILNKIKIKNEQEKNKIIIDKQQKKNIKKTQSNRQKRLLLKEIKQKKIVYEYALEKANNEYAIFLDAVKDTPLFNKNDKNHKKKKQKIYQKSENLKKYIEVFNNKLKLLTNIDVQKNDVRIIKEIIKKRRKKDQETNIKIKNRKMRRFYSLLNDNTPRSIEKLEKIVNHKKLIKANNEVYNIFNINKLQLEQNIKNKNFKLKNAFRNKDMKEISFISGDIEILETELNKIKENRKKLKSGEYKASEFDADGNYQSKWKSKSKSGGSVSNYFKQTNNPNRRQTNNPNRRQTNNPTRRQTNNPTRRQTNTPTRRQTNTPTRRQNLNTTANNVGANPSGPSVDLSNPSAIRHTFDLLKGRKIEKINDNEFFGLMNYATKNNRNDLINWLNSNERYIIQKSLFDPVNHKAILDEQFDILKKMLPLEKQKIMDIDYIKKMINDSNTTLKKKK